MVILIEITDNTVPRELSFETEVELTVFGRLVDAIIYVEPDHMDEEDSLVLTEAGVFGLIPKDKSGNLPKLEQEWVDQKLAAHFFAIAKKHDVTRYL